VKLINKNSDVITLVGSLLVCLCFIGQNDTVEISEQDAEGHNITS